MKKIPLKPLDDFTAVHESLFSNFPKNSESKLETALLESLDEKHTFRVVISSVRVPDNLELKYNVGELGFTGYLIEIINAPGVTSSCGRLFLNNYPILTGFLTTKVKARDCYFEPSASLGLQG